MAPNLTHKEINDVLYLARMRDKLPFHKLTTLLSTLSGFENTTPADFLALAKEFGAMLLTPDRLEKYGSHTLSIVDYTLDDAHLETRCPLDNGRHNGQPKHSVGRLDLLPYELISQVLLALDLPSRTAFRRVNRRAMGLVDSLHEYQMVLKHCPNILRAIISINAKHFDLATLYRTLCTTKCAACNGSFGSYLYLITCKRVCYSCFTEKSAYLPVSAMLDIRNTSLSRDDLKSLPHIFSLPGYYTKSKNLARGRTMLVDLQSMNKRASEIRGTKVFIRVSTQCATTDENRRHMAIISAPSLVFPKSLIQVVAPVHELINSLVPDRFRA